MFITSRILLIVLIFLTQLFLPPGPNAKVARIKEHGGGLLDTLTQSDGVWYRGIAEHGYQAQADGKAPLSTAFFPFYPILIRAGTWSGLDYQLASVFISNLALLGAAILFSRTVQLEYKNEIIARHSVAFLMFGAPSFFFSAGQAEGIFLFFSIAAFAAALRQKWLWASLAGICLSATRPTGFLIVLPLLVEYLAQWRQAGGSIKSLIRARVFWLALVPVGAAFYVLYCQVMFGDGLAYAHAQSSVAWDRGFTMPWQTFLSPKNETPEQTIFFRWVAVVVFALIGAGGLFKIRPSYFVHALIGFVFPLCWTTLNDIFRYFCVLFPIYLVMALIAHRYRGAYTWLLSLNAGLMGFCVAIWANAYR